MRGVGQLSTKVFYFKKMQELAIHYNNAKFVTVLFNNINNFIEHQKNLTNKVEKTKIDDILCFHVSLD